jgi:hypothetical protein
MWRWYTTSAQRVSVLEQQQLQKRKPGRPPKLRGLQLNITPVMLEGLGKEIGHEQL